MDGLNRRTLERLENYLRQSNPLIQQFQYAGEVQRSLDESRRQEVDPHDERVILMINTRDTDR